MGWTGRRHHVGSFGAGLRGRRDAPTRCDRRVRRLRSADVPDRRDVGDRDARVCQPPSRGYGAPGRPRDTRAHRQLDREEGRPAARAARALGTGRGRGMNAMVVRAAERHRQTGQTSGMVREEAFHAENTWAGVAYNAPRAVSGWHHHGDHASTIYVLSGRIRIECGPGGSVVLDGGPGDFLLIPPREVHRESNPADGTTQIVLVRAGQGAVVVNVEGPP